MFQIELLSGGVFWAYAVDTAENMFLIYRDSQWNWIRMEECRPYYQPWIGVTTAVSEPPDERAVTL